MMQKVNGPIDRGTQTQQEPQPWNLTQRDSFLCPITRAVMKYPVVAADGFTYEEAAIRAWLARRQVSPMTQMPMAHTRLLPNRTLLAMIKNDSEYAEPSADTVGGGLPDSVYTPAASRSPIANPPPRVPEDGLQTPSQPVNQQRGIVPGVEHYVRQRSYAVVRRVTMTEEAEEFLQGIDKSISGNVAARFNTSVASKPGQSPSALDCFKCVLSYLYFHACS